MPKNELLDLLFALFERWQYWSLKKLRTETQQPESYLRETLTGIADLHKRGPYVGNWSLKPEYANMRKTEPAPAASSSAPAQSHNQEEDLGENDTSDDDDDDEEDFDDVV
jgi:transcription initiation factor TFIIF subunit beta